MKIWYVVLTLVCIGCGKKEATPPAVVSSPAAAETRAVAAPPAAAPSPASTAALATAEKESGSVRAELMELKRTSGDIVMLRVILTNTGGAVLQNGSMEYSDPDMGGQDYGSVGGIHLIDPVNKKKYFVLRDANNKCVCTRDFPTFTKPGEHLTFWARFPAPPEDVRKISVMIPHFPPIDDIAIAR